MSNGQFIAKLLRFLKDMEDHCKYALHVVYTGDNFIDEFLDYMMLSVKSFNYDWQEIKEEREKNARNN